MTVESLTNVAFIFPVALAAVWLIGVNIGQFLKDSKIATLISFLGGLFLFISAHVIILVYCKDYLVKPEATNAYSIVIETDEGPLVFDETQILKINIQKKLYQ